MSMGRPRKVWSAGNDSEQMAMSSVDLSFQARFCINVACLEKEVREPWGKVNREKN